MTESKFYLLTFISFLIFANRLSLACKKTVVSTDGLGNGIQRGARELNQAIQKASGDLSYSIDRGVDAAAKAVNKMSDTVIGLAKSVNMKIDSGDLEKIGGVASRNLAEGLVNLTRNWELAVNTSHLQTVGADAAKHLSQALQNIKLHLKVDVGDNVVTMTLYISIAAGFSFSVLFIAIVVSLKSCRKCVASLFELCVHKYRDNNQPIESEESQEDVECNLPLKNANNFENVSGASKKATTMKENIKRRESLAGYSEFNNLKNFWQKGSSSNN